MLTRTLEKLGLSEKEAKVYMTLLEFGQATVQQIARKAGVVRPTTYVILDTLSKKGLATTIEQAGKVYFAPEPPELLKHFLSQQEKELEQKVSELKRALPELESIFSRSGTRPVMRFYEGKEGVDAADEDAFRTLQPSEEIFAFTPLDQVLAVYPDAFTTAPEHRLKYNLWTNVIYTSKRGQIASMDSAKHKRRARYLAPEKFPFAAIVTIVPNRRVQITSLEGRIFAIVIEDATVANSLKAIWDLIWPIAEK